MVRYYRIGGNGMKVLLVNGSPHKEGCTFTALSKVALELNKEGIETEIFHIGTDPVRGCIGCAKCRENSSGRCVFDDDITNRLLERAEGCDGFVFGSPVYYASPNGALLAVLDRAFYAGKSFAYKPGAVIASARRAGTTATIEVLSKYLTICNMPVVSSQYWPMVHGSNKEQVVQDLEGMQTMGVIGKNMAWLLKSIKAGEESGVTMPELEKREWTNFIRQ